MNPDRYREIKDRWAAIDLELADLHAGKVVVGSDPADREVELLEEQDGLEFELGKDYLRERRA